MGGSGRVGGSCVQQFVRRGAAKVYVGGTNQENFLQAQARWIHNQQTTQGRRRQQQEQPQSHEDDDGNLDDVMDDYTTTTTLSRKLEAVEFVELNREKVDSVKQAIQSLSLTSSSSSSSPSLLDLVVHTAGPFQGKVTVPNGVLEACLDLSIPYIDVCDDYCTAQAAKTHFMDKARTASIPCIVSTGCWPGVSSLMARQMIDDIIQQQQQQEQHKQQQQMEDQNSISISPTTDTNTGWDPSEWTVKFSFFTAGSGGAGVTLLVATFLILSEQALVVESRSSSNGNRTRRRLVDPMREYDCINFGSIVGNRNVAHLNLLETASIAETLQVGNVQAKFGTAPPFWNALLGFMARTLPSFILSNEEWMQALSIFSLPIVRVVDAFAGATNAMRCDVIWEKNVNNNKDNMNINNNEDIISTTTTTTTTTETTKMEAAAIYAHENLEPCVGECVSAFGAALLSSTTTNTDNTTTTMGNNNTPIVVPPGIWFPEEAFQSRADVDTVLELARCGAHTYDTSMTLTPKTTNEPTKIKRIG